MKEEKEEVEAECREEKGQRGKIGIEIESQKEIFILH